MPDQNSGFGTLISGAIALSAIHAVIPSHWLPFAMVGRARRWTTSKVLGLTAVAALGHVAITTIVGCIVAVVSKSALPHLPEAWEHIAPSIILILLGVGFIIPSFRGEKGCHHPNHQHPLTNVETTVETASNRSDILTVGALLAGMTVSPCLDLVPIYVAAARQSWLKIMTLSGVMAVVTLSLMLMLVSGAIRGLEHPRLRFLEQNEGLWTGGGLILLAIILLGMKG